ncbi:hypothetical protein [Hymenobacter sp. GOD-10R]|uniref:hypothetical protein n=1 Tax=Hymenobacter sp. GOD-10R TaxID=3093922 RepID=UPI002D7942C4|nr:hypothetical protein [Hymenobacter sp. GOD-10R]WRQ30155.1 hypothetical protein SD425_07760 [Hymenobacter sp. GOD-10R]
MPISRFFRSYSTLSLLGSTLLLATGCTDDTDDLSLKHQETITVTQKEQALYPEGVQFDAQNNCFVVGSQTFGTIGRVSDYNTYQAFINDTSLISSVGVNVDRASGRLLVAVGDLGYNTTRSTARTLRKTARVVIFDNNTGARLRYLALDSLFQRFQPHYANDIALDGAGTAYVTDSFSPVIYRINSQNAASIFKQDALLAPSGPGVIGLNGIAYNTKGFVVTVKSDTGTLLKIPVNGNGTGGTITKITTDQDLTGGDGMQFQGDSTLLVVLNKQNKIVRLHSTDNWLTATTTGTFTTPDVYPTTLARRTAQEPYVLYSHLNALQNNQQPPVREFTIQKVRF